MAKSKPKSASKKVTPAKKPAAKAKPAPKAKPVAKAKPAAKSKVVVKAKPAPKTTAKAPVKAPVKAPAKVPTRTIVEPKKEVLVAPKIAVKPVPAVKATATPKPTPTISPAKPAVKMPKPSMFKPMSRDDDDEETVVKRAGTSSDLFTEEELTTFRNMLNEEKRKILAKSKSATASGNIALEKDEMYDEVDLASATAEQNLTLRLLDRDHKLLAEIDHAIEKIDTGEYGFCEGTGEVIPKRRLELRPWCRHSVKYKEQLERMKKSGRGVADEDEAF